jgi:hypothetical protein
MAELKEVKFLKYHPLFAYSVGDECKLLVKDADMLIKGGFAISIGAKSETIEDTDSKEARESEKAVGKPQRGKK